MMWIEHVPYENANGRLKMLYDRIKGPGDNVDNIMLAHSLRPHTMEGHMTIYKYVLHHASNQTPKWFLETLGVYVSLLNSCAYCIEHHFAGLQRLLGNPARGRDIRNALEGGTFAGIFSDSEIAALRYAEALTTAPGDAPVLARRVEDMRNSGLDDGRILEINQVVAYFAYANRTVLGLGVTAEGDILGLSPGDSNDAENWSHR